MKIILSFVLSGISSIVLSQGFFEVQGELIMPDYSEDIMIIVYSPDTEGNWGSNDTIFGNTSYHLEVSTNEAYLLLFKHPLGDKLLWLDLSDQEGFYTMNVNFEYTTHGVIRYNADLLRYTSYLVDNETVKEVFNIEP